MRTFTTRATGTGNIAMTVTPSNAWQLEEIRVHLSAVGAANTLTARLDALAGSTYDVVILSQNMTSVTDLIYIPDRPQVFEQGSSLIVAWTNGSAVTYGVEVKYRTAV
jgi:hypothetical protein